MAIYNITSEQLKGRGILNSFELAAGGGFTNQYSIDFDGTDDSVNIADNSNLSFGDGSSDSPFSISAWVKIDSTGESEPIAQKYSSYPNGEYRLLKGSDGKVLFRIISQNQELNRRGRKTDSIDSLAGQWVHIVSTYNGNSNYSGIKIYVNGVRSDTVNDGKNAYVAMNNTSSPLKIGEGTDGNIDEVAVFDSELSESDVTAIYNSGVPNDLTSLSPLSWWRMGDNDGGTGTTVTDQGSGDNDGTLTNDAAFTTDVPS